MARNYSKETDKCEESKTRRQRGGKKYRKPSNSNGKSRMPENNVTDGSAGNPAWYFVNKDIAEQVSQLSMRNFAGIDYKLNNKVFKSPAFCTIYLNPSPGVQDNYLQQGRKSGINMASYKLYSRLAMHSGRVQNYAPQDVATLILAFGEIISVVEYIRRAFGVAYTYSERNRAYPRQALNAMGIKADDFMNSLALHRNRFNKLVTLINSIPVPKNIAYFDKCATLYEKIYLDDASPMAQSIVYVPATTWLLDETSYDQGTILSTTPFCMNESGNIVGMKSIEHFMDILENMVSTMFQSSTFNIIYADILNYFSKTGAEAWKFDFLPDGYQVIPEFSEEFKLHFHNMTFVSSPKCPITYTGQPEMIVTKYNDVVPDVNDNLIIYNPGFDPNEAVSMPNATIIDFQVVNPGWEDRLEASRFKSITGDIDVEVESVHYNTGAVLTDHYGVAFIIWSNNVDDNSQTPLVWSTSAIRADQAADILDGVSRFKDHPYLYVHPDATDVAWDGRVIGDTSFWTAVDKSYLQPIVDFVALDLYDFRS